MKCNFCGANINIKDEFCPHCGMKKAQFEAHRKDMNRYHKEFEDTKETVVKENITYSSLTARIAVCAVLATVFILLLFANHSSYELSRIIKIAQIKANQSEHLKALSDYEKNDQFLEFSYYFNQNDLYYATDRSGSAFNEYELLDHFGNYYASIIEYILTLHSTDPENSSANTNDEINYLVEYYEYFQNDYKQYITDPSDYSYYSDDCYKEEHLKSYEQMATELDAMLAYYFKLDQNEIDSFPDLTTGQKTVLLEEHMEVLP